MSRTPGELLASYGRSMAWQRPVALGLVLVLVVLWLAVGTGVFMVLVG